MLDQYINLHIKKQKRGFLLNEDEAVESKESIINDINNKINMILTNGLNANRVSNIHMSISVEFDPPTVESAPMEHVCNCLTCNPSAEPEREAPHAPEITIGDTQDTDTPWL